MAAIRSIILVFDVIIAYSPFALLKRKGCAGLIGAFYEECATECANIDRAVESKIKEE